MWKSNLRVDFRLGISTLHFKSKWLVESCWFWWWRLAEFHLLGDTCIIPTAVCCSVVPVIYIFIFVIFLPSGCHGSVRFFGSRFRFNFFRQLRRSLNTAIRRQTCCLFKRRRHATQQGPRLSSECSMFVYAIRIATCCCCFEREIVFFHSRILRSDRLRDV